ncbi:MAG: bis(5'-nucleosyl)-tetraphosphatase (symmetrical) YqeK [Elusimicrobiota bacterium]|jgi:nicotinate-nucleotide adenylyltransferase
MNRPLKILLFGGSFDPPHLGHLALLRAALRRARPDRAYVLPAWQSPLKVPSGTPARTRLGLLDRALAEGLSPAERRAVVVDRFELQRGRRTYSYEAVRRLRRLHPGTEILFLAGSDFLDDFARWRRPEELLRSCRFLVGARPGSSAPAEAALLGFERLPGDFPEISSTEVRRRLLCGEDLSELLSPGVRRALRAQGLYGTAVHRLLAARLEPKRYRHTLAVARIACELAARHGLAVERAALAGLLHDCGRILSPSAMTRYARAHRLEVPFFDEVVARRPGLLHAYVGADLGAKRFGVQDPAVLSAVRKHTLGDPRMTRFDRLLYTADACSEDRSYPEAVRIRRLARRDLDDGFRETVRVKLTWVLTQGDWMHPYGPALWNQACAG